MFSFGPDQHIKHVYPFEKVKSYCLVWKLDTQSLVMYERDMSTSELRECIYPASIKLALTLGRMVSAARKLAIIWVPCIVLTRQLASYQLDVKSHALMNVNIHREQPYILFWGEFVGAIIRPDINTCNWKPLHSWRLDIRSESGRLRKACASQGESSVQKLQLLQEEYYSFTLNRGTWCHVISASCYPRCWQSCLISCPPVFPAAIDKVR